MASHKLKRISSAYTVHNNVKLVRAGKAYFNLLLQMISGARESIHLQTYIFEDDETGRMVAAALVAAVKKGVQVYMITDAYASGKLPKQFVAHLEQGGVNFRFFEPIFKSKHFYVGRRLHHKLVVVDAKYCMVGGINIGDRYNDTKAGSAWLDFALYAEGDIAWQVYLLARKTWQGFALQKKLPPINHATGPTIHPIGNSLVRLRQNDWVNRKNQISRTYREMLNTASSHIMFVCSYFMPGNKIKRYITNAIKRGVKISVIMAGQSDVWVAKNAERFMYDWLLRNNIQIFEYQGNMLHAKLAVADGQWLTVGSYNVNNISAYASVELNLDVRSEPFAKEVEDALAAIVANDCLPVTQEVLYKTRNIFSRCIRWLSYEFIRLMIFLFTFYFKQRKQYD